MSYAEDAAEAVRAAEKAVAQLVGSASAAQDWDEAGRLIGLGRQLRFLAEQVSQPASASPRPNLAVQADLQPTTSTVRASSTSKKASYPMFFREGDTLVKVAWSKSQRNEYEHKSPRKVIGLLVQVLLQVGQKGKRFSMDRVLPVRDAETGSDVPEYQVYVVFAWLKSMGMIEQHGRGGYSISDIKAFAEGPARCWEGLASR